MAAALAAIRFSLSTSGTPPTLEACETGSARHELLAGQRPRPTLHQHDPDAVDRCRPGGKLGPPGHPDGDGARRVRALAAVPALRSRGPNLAESRPLRAVCGARLDAALLAASP